MFDVSGTPRATAAKVKMRRNVPRCWIYYELPNRPVSVSRGTSQKALAEPILAGVSFSHADTRAAHFLGGGAHLW